MVIWEERKHSFTAVDFAICKTDLLTWINILNSQHYYILTFLCCAGSLGREWMETGTPDGFNRREFGKESIPEGSTAVASR